MTGNGAYRVNRMSCEACGTAWFSAAAAAMVDNGDRCAVCGGELALDPLDAERIGVTAGREGRGPDDDDGRGRRFSRPTA